MLQRLLLAYLRLAPIDHGKHALAKLLKLEGLKGLQRFTTRSGITYLLDLGEYVQRNIFVFGDYERNTMRHVRRMIRPGDTVVDIGGNIGFYALEMARLNSPGRLISFEPNPAAIERFKANRALNPALSNIELVEHGLGEKPGSFTLSFNRGNLGTASAFGKSDERIEVLVDTLDAVLAAKGVERIDVLKIDIEGGELSALRGARGIIGKSTRMMLVIEIIDAHCKRAGYTGAELFDLIIGMGFKAYLPKPWPLRMKSLTRYNPGYFDNIMFLKGH